MRVLLVEDDDMIAASLSRALRDDGYAVDRAGDAISAGEAIAMQCHAMVVLDLGLPVGDGMVVLRAMRARGDARPVIVITARYELESRIAGLDIGADDYVVKPFDYAELAARMRAVTRRQNGRSNSMVLAGELALDLANNEVSFRGKRDVLPPREFSLLRALCERPGTILSRAQLEDRLYGWGEEVQSNAVEVLIHYVRNRFGRDVIRNVRGAGWMVTKLHE
jgi:DNA-binding response OmpR family regulator